MTAPNVADLATSLITVAPSPANSGTSLTVTASEGSRFPSVPFNATVVPEGELPTLDNAEIVLVTAVDGDEFTITRAQGVTSAQEIAVGWRIFNGIYAAHIEGAYQAAADVPFDDTVISTASGGNVTGDTVQEFGDNFVSFLVPVISGLFATVGGLDSRVDALEAAGGGIEPRDRLNVLIGIEDRSKYALLGGGKFSSYDSHGFKIPNGGNLPDGGFDIYNEFVPLWQGASPDNEQWTFQEVFTIEDDAAWGGDLVETAICWKGRNPVPFAELTAADSASVNGSGNGYGEYPSVIYQNNEYNGEVFMLQRVRYTYNPSTGQLLMYRPIYPNETPDDNAFDIDWKIAGTTNHASPGSHPLADVDPTKSLKVGKGSGRYLVSRVIVNGFDGTPYCDFNPVENTVDENTVYDPVLDDNWTNTDSAFARVVQSDIVVDNWFNTIDVEQLEQQITNLEDLSNQLGDTVTAEIVPAYANQEIAQGSENVPTSSSSSGSARVRLSRYTMEANGKLQKIKLNSQLNTAGTMKVKAVVYSDNAGAPDQLLATSAEINVTNTSQQYNQYTFSGAEQYEFDEDEVLWIGTINEDVAANYIINLVGSDVAGLLNGNGIIYTDPVPTTYPGTNYTNNGVIALTIIYKKLGVGVNVIGGGSSGFEPTGDYDRTSTYVYIGYEHSDGRWYIYRRTLSNNTKLYASGSSDYATNWTGRAGLTYS